MYSGGERVEQAGGCAGCEQPGGVEAAPQADAERDERGDRGKRVNHAVRGSTTAVAVRRTSVPTINPKEAAVTPAGKAPAGGCRGVRGTMRPGR